MTRFVPLAAIICLSILLIGCPSTPKTPDTVAAPGFAPAEGVFTTAQSVALATSTEGAEIRYTTDSSMPSATEGTVYSGPITVSATTTIRAIATKPGWSDSPVASATYTITGTVASVTFDPASGTFDESVTVTLGTTTQGAQIYYTTDGSQPAPSSGILYAGPISVTSSQTLSAIAVKQSWDSSVVTTAAYTVNPKQVVVEPQVEPVSDVEVSDARNALARAKEVDADFFDPDNYDAARRLLDEGVDLRVNDPATARKKLAGSKEAADTAFTNSVQRAAEIMAASMEAARQRLLGLEADKFTPSEYDSSTAGIDAAAALFAANDYANARARGYQALKEMTDLANRLEARLATVRQLKLDVENLMKDLESSDAYTWAPGQKDTVTGYYLAGLNAYKGYGLDDAEENFGAAKVAAQDALRIAREAKDTTEAQQKAVAEQLQQQAMEALIEASKLTVVTEDGTVVEPQNWTDEDFLKEIDKMIQEEQNASGGQSMLIPSDGSTAVMADESTGNLLQQARDLWAAGIKEKAAGNYAKAQDYFNESLRYIEIYKSYAVKGVYTVRLIPDRRDCLWRIAEYAEVYGDPYKWPTIWRRNRKLIQNPDLIYPGWQLVIPPQ
jgi:nucleoid-associated protein YgaU